MSSNTQIDFTYDLLNRGETEIQLRADHKSIVLVLGNTGSGKSTFTQWITDSNKLIAKEINTNEYTIEDNHRIDSSTIELTTIFPELVVDNKTYTSYYDCPGFSDTKSTSLDITATYFMKKVINHAQSLKIILTVSYPSLHTNVDRYDFMKLLRHSTELINDINKYRNSIALVVTKVDNQYVGQGKTMNLVADTQVINNVATFLQEVKQALQARLKLSDNSGQDNISSWNAIKLIDILLIKESNKYSRIGIFRRPNQSGPLNNNTLLQKGKRHIEMIIKDELSFTEKIVDDFGLTISESSKNVINDLADVINKQIVSGIRNIGVQLQKYFPTTIEQSKDIYKLQNDFDIEYTMLSKVKEETVHGLKVGFKPTEILEKTLNTIEKLYYNVNITTEKENTVKQCSYLEFLQQMTDKMIITKPLEWTNALTDIQNFLYKLKNWYTFLTRLHNALSSYRTQKNRSKIISRLQDLGSFRKMQELKVNKNNVKQFYEKLNQIDILRVHEAIKSTAISDLQLRDLNYILKMTLNETTYTCDSEKLIVKGNFIIFSEISFKTCESINALELFALQTVFVDQDLIQIGKKLQLTIIAPKWEVIGHRIINLDGASGRSHSKAVNSDGKGESGNDGLPGLSGGAAGNFIGIGQEFINSKHLIITANGGNGGPGQNGGNGGEGYKGETPSLSKGYDNFERKFLSQQLVVALVYNHDDKWYEIYGKEGGKGGTGGNGGAGGLGGAKGDIRIINFNNSLDIGVVTSNHRGLVGRGGKGGKGGAGGHYGDTVIIPYHMKFLLFVPIQMEWGRVSNIITSAFRGPKGHDGIGNYNGIKRQQPESKVEIENHSKTIEDYKKYLSENLNNRLRKTNLSQFINLLNSNQELLDDVADKHHRNVRAINNYDELKMLTTSSNAAISKSAPINDIFNWVTDKLSLLKAFNPLNYLQKWQTVNNNFTQSPQILNQQYQDFQQQNKYSSGDPIHCYEQLDSILVIAPVILHLWKNIFHKKTIKTEDMSLTIVSQQRIKIWNDMLDDARETIQALQIGARSSQIEVNAFIDVLETRREDVNLIAQQMKVDSLKIEELERNLIALQVDLEDEVKYNKAFEKIKYDETITKTLFKLIENAEQLPEYSRKLKLVKLNYRPCSIEQTLGFNHAEYLRFNEGVSFDTDLSVIGHNASSIFIHKSLYHIEQYSR